MPEPKLTTREAAVRLGVSPGRIRHLVTAGRLHPERVETPRGPVFYFRQAEIDAFVRLPHGRPRKPPAGP